MISIRRRRAVVNLVTGETIVGERRLSWPWSIRLTGAIMPAKGRDGERRIDGSVVLHWRAVTFVQMID